MRRQKQNQENEIEGMSCLYDYAHIGKLGVRMCHFHIHALLYVSSTVLMYPVNILWGNVSVNTCIKQKNCQGHGHLDTCRAKEGFIFLFVCVFALFSEKMWHRVDK